MIDATLIATGRSRAVGPIAGANLGAPLASGRSWTGEHHHHGDNTQVVTARDGWPIWTSPVRPGCEHGPSRAGSTPTTCAHPSDLLTELDAWATDGAVLAALGYEVERERFGLPVKNTRGVAVVEDQACLDALRYTTRALAERGNALTRMTPPYCTTSP